MNPSAVKCGCQFGLVGTLQAVVGFVGVAPHAVASEVVVGVVAGGDVEARLRPGQPGAVAGRVVLIGQGLAAGGGPGEVVGVVPDVADRVADEVLALTLSGVKVSLLHTWLLLAMVFGKRLVALRKARAITQQALTDQGSWHVTMSLRYEANETQPTPDVIRKLTPILSVSADALVFEQDERGPTDELRLQFEAARQLPPDEQSVVKKVLESLIIKYQTRRWDLSRTAVAVKKLVVTKRAHAAAH